MEKVKVLITGPVNNDFPSLIAKLSSLQKSKAGPFHICFCTGPFFGSSGSDGDGGKTNAGNEKNESYQKAKDFLNQGSPIPLYFCDVGLVPSGINLPSYEELNAEDVQDEAEISLDDDDDDEDDNKGEKITLEL